MGLFGDVPVNAVRPRGKPATWRLIAVVAIVLVFIFLAQPRLAPPSRAQGGQEWQVYPNGTVVTPNGTVITVGDPLAFAVASARPGSTIMVHGGTYHEDVVINRTLTLVGVGTPSVIGTSYDYSIGVGGNASVIIEGFSLPDGIRGSQVASLTVVNSTVGSASGSAIHIDYLYGNITLEDVSGDAYNGFIYVDDMAGPHTIAVEGSNVSAGYYVIYVGSGGPARVVISGSNVTGTSCAVDVPLAAGVSVINSNVYQRSIYCAAIYVGELSGNVTLLNSGVSAYSYGIFVQNSTGPYSIIINGSSISSSAEEAAYVGPSPEPMSLIAERSTIYSGGGIQVSDAGRVLVEDSTVDISEDNDLSLGSLWGNVSVINSTVLSPNYDIIGLGYVSEPSWITFVRSKAVGQYIAAVNTPSSPVGIAAYGSYLEANYGLSLTNVSAFVAVNSTVNVTSGGLDLGAPAVRVSLVGSRVYAGSLSGNVSYLYARSSLINLTGGIGFPLYLNGPMYLVDSTVYAGSNELVAAAPQVIISGNRGSYTVYIDRSGLLGLFGVEAVVRPGAVVHIDIVDSTIDSNSSIADYFYVTNGTLDLSIDDSYVGSWSGPWIQEWNGAVLFPGGGTVFEASSVNVGELRFLDSPGGQPMDYVAYWANASSISLGYINASVYIMYTSITTGSGNATGYVGIVEFSNAPFGCQLPEGAHLYSITARIFPQTSGGELYVSAASPVSWANLSELNSPPQCWVSQARQLYPEVQFNGGVTIGIAMAGQVTYETTSTTFSATTTKPSTTTLTFSTTTETATSTALPSTTTHTATASTTSTVTTPTSTLTTSSKSTPATIAVSAGQTSSALLVVASVIVIVVVLGIVVLVISRRKA